MVHPISTYRLESAMGSKEFLLTLGCDDGFEMTYEFPRDLARDLGRAVAAEPVSPTRLQ
jgi:hypothetical protein